MKDEEIPEPIPSAEMQQLKDANDRVISSMRVALGVARATVADLSISLGRLIDLQKCIAAIRTEERK